jgi:hypothetical protein
MRDTLLQTEITTMSEEHRRVIPPQRGPTIRIMEIPNREILMEE